MKSNITSRCTIQIDYMVKKKPTTINLTNDRYNKTTQKLNPRCKRSYSFWDWKPFKTLKLNLSQYFGVIAIEITISRFVSRDMFWISILNSLIEYLIRTTSYTSYTFFFMFQTTYWSDRHTFVTYFLITSLIALAK